MDDIRLNLHVDGKNTIAMKADKVRAILDTMGELFPDAHCELEHANPFELAIAVLLSAQCTDQTVNKVTRILFQKYKTPGDYVGVPLTVLQSDIRQIGLYRNKAKHIQQMCETLIANYHGQLPRAHEDLIKLAGVGRKTANVIVSVAYDVPAIAVDTHVDRVSKRLGFAKNTDTVLEVEKKLMKQVPRDEWSLTHHRMIHFGRYHCKAQQPRCEQCPLLDRCKDGPHILQARLSKRNGTRVKSQKR
jgi:endonuclease-3